MGREHRYSILRAKRVLYDTNYHPILLVPALVNQGDHEMLEKTLDEITLLPKYTSHSLVDSSMLFEAYRNTDKPYMARTAFKTINRLQYWHYSWLDYALDYLKEDLSIIKEIAIYIYWHEEMLLSQPKMQIIVNYASPDKQHILYFIYVFNHFWDQMSKYQRVTVMPLVNQGVHNDYDTKKISLAILSKSSEYSCYNILCLKEISYTAMTSDFQTSSTAFEILLNLAADDAHLNTIMEKHKFMDIVRRFIKHPFQAQRRAAYWGYSNICASIDHTKEAISMKEYVVENYRMEKGIQERTEIQYAIVNLLTVMNEEELKNTKLDDMLLIILDAMESVLPDLASKALLSLISALSQSDLLRIQLLRIDIERHLQTINQYCPYIDQLCYQLTEMLKQHNSIT